MEWGPQQGVLLAVLNNMVLGLFARQGETNIAHARCEFAYQFDKALATLAALREKRSCNSPVLNIKKQLLSSLSMDSFLT